MLIGFLGPKGTFSEVAASQLTGELIPFNTIPDVFNAVIKSKVDKGVVPVENSVEGSVSVVLDMLSLEGSPRIQGEIVLPINHYLLLNPDVELDDVKVIYSHPQALAQCRNFLEKNKLKTITTESTAAAANKVKGHLNRGAIGNQRAAEIYGLKIASKKIQDYSNNTTRFIILGKDDQQPTGRDKTSLVFSLPQDHPGGLYEVLGEFARKNINLTKIESRPSKGGLGSYIFFLDFEGHVVDEVVRNVLNKIKSKLAYQKILGSYPRAGDD